MDKIKSLKKEKRELNKELKKTEQALLKSSPIVNGFECQDLQKKISLNIHNLDINLNLR